MIALAINSQFLDLSKGLSIPMEEAFAFDEFLSIPGEHSWKFSLPKTPTNRRAFGFADVPDVVWSPATSYPCSIYLDGRVFKSGRLYIEGDTNAGFEVYFLGTVGVLKEKIKGIKLNELAEWGEITGISNMFDYAEAVVVNPAAPVTFAECAMPNNPGLSQFINNSDLQRQISGVWEGFERTGLTLMVPFVRLKWFWQVLIAEFDFSIQSQFLQDPEIESLIFFNLKPLNLVNTSGAFTQTFPTNIIIKEHVPDVSLESFLVDFAKLFNLILTFDGITNTLHIIARKQLLSGSRKIITQRVVSVQTLFEEYKTYSLKYAYDEAEPLAAADWDGNLEGIIGAQNSEVIESEVSTLHMWDKGNDGQWHIPVTINKIGEDPGVRLLFYRGLQNTWLTGPGTIGPMPLATSDNRYTTGFNYSLTWQDASGLYAQWWQPWLDVVLAGRTLKLQLALNTTDLADFNPLHMWVIDHWRCFVKKLEYNLGDEDGVVDLEVLKF